MPENAQICKTCRNPVMRLWDTWLHAPPNPLPAWSIAAAQLDGDHVVEPAGAQDEA